MKSDVVVGLKQIVLTTALVASLVTPAAYAEDNSAKLDDGSVSTGLSMHLEPAHHKFMRLSYIYIKPNTKTSPTKDVTGPVISKQDAQCLSAGGCGVSTLPAGLPQIYARSIFGTGLLSAMQQDGTALNGVPSQATGVGLPTGITADAKGAGSLAISAGTFFDDDYKWSAEVYVFAWPFSSSVTGGGSVTEIDNNTGAITRVRPNNISGKEIIKTQELPPTAVFSYYFNDKKSAFRPFLGVGVTYAMFFNSHATQTLSDYSGGPTQVKLKNAFGAGPFMGLQYRLGDNWHIAAQFGYVKLKTTATLTTQTSAEGLYKSLVLQDFSGYVGATNRGVSTTTPEAIQDGLRALQNYRGGSLGTYVRSMDTKLDPYIMTVSVGYDF